SNTPQPGLFSIHPNLQFDTYVAAPPNLASPLILGAYTTTGSAVFSSNNVDVVWGDLQNTGSGTFVLAQLTITKSSVGSLHGDVYSNNSPGTSVPFSANLPIGSSLGTIAGKLYNDSNGNGVADSTETGLSN